MMVAMWADSAGRVGVVGAERGQGVEVVTTLWPCRSSDAYDLLSVTYGTVGYVTVG